MTRALKIGCWQVTISADRMRFDGPKFWSKYLRVWCRVSRWRKAAQ